LRRSWLGLTPRLFLAITAAVVCTLGAGGGGDRAIADEPPVVFGIWGDMPYARNGDNPKIPVLINDMNRANLGFSVFLGDVKDGASVCSDANIGASARDRFNSLSAPAVYVPGDNEWTDCHRTNNGPFDPLERLTYLRRHMFNTGETFGQRKMPIERQARAGEPYSENTRWVIGGIVFAGIHVVGSNNNKVNAGSCTEAASTRTQAQCDAANVEYLMRDAMNIQWLRRSFDLARQTNAPSLMIFIQANPGFDLVDTVDVNERTLPANNGFTNFVDALVNETRAYKGQVVLVHGDSHYFRIDKPLINQERMIQNFTRVEGFGSPNVQWLKVTVDPKRRDVFEFEQMLVPGN
jgi:hypothetical protein